MPQLRIILMETTTYTHYYTVRTETDLVVLVFTPL